MADNLGQFRTRIRRYLRETNEDTSFWDDSFINQMFNASYRRRCSNLMMAYEGWFSLVAVRDITEDKSTYGFPASLQRLLKVELVRSDGRTTPLERWERHDEINSAADDVLTGDQYFPHFRPFSNGIVLEPTPQETVTDGLRIEYSGLPVFLSGDSDRLHPSFPELLDELVVLDTVVTALQAEGVHETGPGASMYRLRAEWQEDWDRFIEGRTIFRDRIDPFMLDPDY
jgi:hypothetical protein